MNIKHGGFQLDSDIFPESYKIKTSDHDPDVCQIMFSSSLEKPFEPALHIHKSQIKHFVEFLLKWEQKNKLMEVES